MRGSVLPGSFILASYQQTTASTHSAPHSAMRYFEDDMSLTKILSLALLSLIIILVFPVLEVNLEPVLLHLGGEQPVPVGALLSLLQHE